MAKQRTASPSRTMKPVFLIFCEGETEEAYLDYLKTGISFSDKDCP